MTNMMTDANRNEIIEEDLDRFILKRYETQSEAFTDPSAQLARRLYRAAHPTEIIVMKCMDGRLNMSLYTETPPGILQPFRNIGGKFDAGWPFYQELMRDTVHYAIGKARQCVIISSYHFSKGDHHRGCAGFHYDTNQAKAGAFALRDQFTGVCGSAPHRPVYALAIGIETDEEALIFHGENGAELNVATLESADPELIRRRLEVLYPDMNGRMIADLVPLIEGNFRHIEKVRRSDRAPIDLEHRENVIAVGRGFDSLHLPNTMLIVGPYSDWARAVGTAASIVKGNLDAGRISADRGVLLLIAALYRQEEGSIGWNLKEEKVKYLFKESHEVISETVPDLLPHLKTLTGVVHADTRAFHPVVIE